MNQATNQENDVNKSGQTYRNWRWRLDDNKYAWLEIDKADTSTNVLSKDVLEELDAALSEISAASPKGLIITSAKSSGFIAGADINEFTQQADEASATELIQRGQRIFDKLEAVSFPTVALINGFCLGGGYELALACRYRVADDGPKTKIGLPEVKLGIHPGFGGTVRLPPIVGAPAAMDMMLSGRMLSARAARKIGAIDWAVPTRHLQDAAVEILKKAPAPTRAKGWKALTNNMLVRPLLANYLKKQVAKKANPDHYPAPYAMIDLWNKHFSNPKHMMREEAASVARLVMGDTAQSLIRVFFLQERVKGLGKLDGYEPTRVHVIGAGVMGGDIAAWCALRGMKVTLQDRSHETLAKVLKRAYSLYSKKLKDPLLVKAAMDRLMPDIQGTGIAQADVIIEAIFENVEAKQSLFRELEPVMKADALLCTNTSSIPLQELSKALKEPSRLVGLHFFNPVAMMQLVEIVSSDETDEKVIQKASAFTRKIDRLPVPVKSTPGFLVNRVLMPYLMEAVVLESEGVPGQVIDKAALKFGMPMGPIRLADTVGLDICLSVAEILSKHLGGEVPQRLRQLVEAGKLGVKSGEGFYKYENGKPVKGEDNSSYQAAEDITDRLMFRLFNECVACLNEKVVADEDLLDTGVIFGTGFAPFRGGPMHYMHKAGIDSMSATIKQLNSRYGERFESDEGWDSLRMSN